jgi:uncharacterized protein YgiM (DUF1202 family)
VLRIPVGSGASVCGGLTYHFSGGGYWRSVHRGHLVVRCAPETVVVREISPVVPSGQSVGEKVCVRVGILNVRSGPGMDFPVIHRVHAGDFLSVHGYAPEWLYVEVAPGTFGWVMLRYTSPLSSGTGG